MSPGSPAIAGGEGLDRPCVTSLSASICSFRAPLSEHPHEVYCDVFDGGKLLSWEGLRCGARCARGEQDLSQGFRCGVAVSAHSDQRTAHSCVCSQRVP
jgi:hypothetical protein